MRSLKAINEITIHLLNLIDKNWRYFGLGSADLTSSPSPNAIARSLLWTEITETARIMETIGEGVLKLQLNIQELGGTQDLLPQRAVSHETEQGRQFLLLMNERMNETSRLIVHVKALYEWLNHVRELLKMYRIQHLVTEVQWNKLEAMCVLRNKLITHKHGKRIHPFGGIRSSRDYTGFQILLGAATPAEDMMKELEALYRDCMNELSQDQKAELHYHERVTNLFSKLDTIHDERRNRIVSFIARYGLFFPKLGDLAEFIDELITELIQNLIKMEY